ncbi:hypothetical protein RQP46_011052 [Phenoliferia psychrophenolica]
MKSPLVPLIPPIVRTFALPAAGVWAMNQYAASVGITIHPFVLPGLYLVSVVVFLYASIGFARWTVVRRADSAGGTLFPVAKGRLPFNIDILTEAQRRYHIEMPGSFFVDLARQYGQTFDTGVLGGAFIITTDPMIMKNMLTKSFTKYEKGPFFNKVFEDFLGSGIFNSDTDMWSAHRSMTRPYFASEKTSDFDIFNRHTDHLINVVETLSASTGSSAQHAKGAVEMQDLFGRFTLDSATEFLMGATIHTCGLRSRLGPLWPMWELRKSRTEEPMSVITPMVLGLIEKALARSRIVNAKGEESGSLLDSLIQKTRDPKVLKDQVLNILLAARDTTMSTLTSAVYCLARDPVILAKLRTEILSIGKDAVPTYEDARGMRYLRAFINEVLRMFPPVPFNVRAKTPDSDDVVVDGEGTPRFIPRGTRVAYSLFNMQRRTDLWGSDAETFDPERWLDQRNDIYKANPFIFQPFSAGARICLGQNFAYNEVSFALIRMLQQYSEIDIAYDVQPKHTVLDKGELLLVSQITLMFTGGLWVRMKKAA